MDILFVLWAACVLTVDGAQSVRNDGRHAADEAWLRHCLDEEGSPVAILDFPKLLKRTGLVNLHARRLAAATFGYDALALAEANRKGIQLLAQVRADFELAGQNQPIVISANLAPRGDGYRVETRRSMVSFRQACVRVKKSRRPRGPVANAGRKSKNN